MHCLNICTGSHLGREGKTLEKIGKTLEKISARFYWRNMYEDIKLFVKVCEKCQKMNPKFIKSNAVFHPVPVQAQVWHKVSWVCMI